ncbi:MAG: hypothetical protein AAGB93_17855 [Planctomycetota bacterium]
MQRTHLFSSGAALALLAAAPLAGAQTLIESFKASNPGINQYFGSDIGTSGDVFAIGAIGANGYAEIWDRSGPNVTFRQRLLSPAPGLGFGFGRSLDAGGGIVAVGALAEDVPITGGTLDRAGNVYIFRDVNGTYELEATLTSGVELGEFGWAVDVSADGRDVLISAPGERSAYWYRDAGGGNWMLDHEVTFTAVGPGRGRSVFIEGDMAFIADPWRDLVRVYERTGGSWSQTQTIGDGEPGNQQFGWSVEATDRWLVVGMPSYEPDGASLYQNSGAAQIYERVGGQWVFSGRVSSPTGETNFQTVYGGWSVSVENDLVLVGAYGNDTATQSSGTAELYEYDGTAWTPVSTIAPPASVDVNHFFGATVHMEDETILIAARGNDDGIYWSGRAYLYTAVGPYGTEYCGPAATNSTGASARTRAFGNVTVSRNEFELRADRLPPQAFAFFLASRTQGLVNNPGGSQGNLCLGGAIGRVLDSAQNSGPAGEIRFMLDLTAIPQPMGAAAAFPGDTWNFQAWYRDANPSATSNYSTGLEVVFQ